MHNELGLIQEDPATFLEPSPEELRAARERTASNLRLFWEQRRFLLRWTLIGLVISLVVALLIPSRYVATTQLMPPDNQSAGGGAALLSAASRSTGSLVGIAGDLLGAKNSGALFVGILSSRTVQDRLIEQFDLRKEYRDSKMEDARVDLARHTGISEDRKSGILSVSVWDHDPQRAASMATAYVGELDRLVAQVSTSVAKRERIFLEERLHAVKQDLDASAIKFSDFASKNTAIDIPAQGKAMVEAAATLQGQLIAAESELHGLEAIYTDQNVRVKALRARVSELRSQLGKLGGESGSAGALPQRQGSRHGRCAHQEIISPAWHVHSCRYCAFSSGRVRMDICESVLRGDRSAGPEETACRRGCPHSENQHCCCRGRGSGDVQRACGA